MSKFLKTTVKVFVPLLLLHNNLYADRIEDFFKGKSAQQSAADYAREIGFPRKIGSVTILEKAYVDPNDLTLVVMELKSTLNPQEGHEEDFIDQKVYMAKNSSDADCRIWKAYFNNGAKLRYHGKWANGKEFSDYILDKDICKLKEN